MSKFKHICILLPLIALLTACSQRGEAIIVAGSTSVQPYVEILAHEYTLDYPDRVVDVQGGGSSAGITAIESGTAAIGMSSRNLKDTEKHLTAIEIAKDGLAVIVHPQNPVTDLSLEQIRMIYSGHYTNWNQLGGEDSNIHVIARENGSGTRTAFEEMVMSGERIMPKAIIQNANGAVRQTVAGDPGSIGFISLGLVAIGDNPVKALYVDGIEPASINIQNGTYPLYRSFLFIILDDYDEDVSHFINYALSPEGQKILITEGLIT